MQTLIPVPAAVEVDNTQRDRRRRNSVISPRAPPPLDISQKRWLFYCALSERLPGSAPAALPAEAEDVLKFERGLRVMIETSTLLNPGSLDTKFAEFGTSPVVPRVKTLARYKVAAVGKKHQT